MRSSSFVPEQHHWLPIITESSSYTKLDLRSYQWELRPLNWNLLVGVKNGCHNAVNISGPIPSTSVGSTSWSNILSPSINYRWSVTDHPKRAPITIHVPGSTCITRRLINQEPILTMKALGTGTVTTIDVLTWACFPSSKPQDWGMSESRWNPLLQCLTNVPIR